MNAKKHILITFGGFIAMGAFALVSVLMGADWRGGNHDVWWFMLIMSAGLFGMCIVSKRKLPMAKWGVKSVLAFDRDITVEEVVNLYQKYCFLLLISSLLFLGAGISAVFVYQ